MTTYAPAEVEIVIFNGIKYRRYPNSKRLNDRNYYRPAANYIKAGVGHLHREIWRAVHGEIPDGHQIHHKDGNPLNNRPDNLVCLSGSEHATLHAKEFPDWKRKWLVSKLDDVREQATQWHRSEEGREWHRQHGIYCMQARDAQQYTCNYCGKEFLSKGLEAPKFCSNNCRSSSRRSEKRDHVEKLCIVCQSLFLSNKYNHTLCCGYKCGAIYREQKKRT